MKDIPATLEALKAKGANVVTGPTAPRPGVLIAFIEGPDQVRVELIDRNA